MPAYITFYPVVMIVMFVQHAPASLAMFDRNLRCLRVSDRWLRETGVAQEDILEKCHYDIFPNLPAHWKEAHRRGLAGESLKAEEDWTAPDGKIHVPAATLSSDRS